METPETIAAQYLSRGAVIDIGSAVSRGWALVRDNLGVLIGATVLGWLISIGLAFVPAADVANPLAFEAKVVGGVVGFMGAGLVLLRRPKRVLQDAV